jgi:predicted CXXCH cytochrome family protein
MPGDRKTKIVAKRIDLSYPKQPAPMRSLRRLLVVLCGVGAAVWGGWALFGKTGDRLYNPGPVAGVHAMIENDCASCHDGGGSEGGGKGGKFLMSVSDAACLKCHNGTIHSEKQTTLVSLTNGKPTMSSNCTTCHVEHKGHEALAGTSDLLCTRCHDDLTKNVAGGKTAMQTSVKTFDGPPAHPAFGLALRQEGKWVDPTPLKFNHKKHLTGINPTVGDCTSCHQMSTSGDHHIMQPVNYDANCKSCHPLTMTPDLPAVPHEAMDIVRLYAAGVPNMISQKLATMTPAEKEKALSITTEKKVGFRIVKETKKVTEAEWVEAQTKDLMEKKVAGSAVANLPAYKAIDNLPPAAKNAAALELYAAYGMATSCSYCHTLAGSPAAVAKSPAEALKTLPTGFTSERKTAGTTTTAAASPATMPSMATSPATPPVATPEGRRWFTSSVFDHESHRSVNCTDCHGQATGSALTSDVLLPDIQSCVQCHHTGGRDKMAASNNCVTCHVYHDRSKDTEPVKGRGMDLLLGKGKAMAAR